MGGIITNCCKRINMLKSNLVVAVVLVEFCIEIAKCWAFLLRNAIIRNAHSSQSFFKDGARYHAAREKITLREQIICLFEQI